MYNLNKLVDLVDDSSYISQSERLIVRVTRFSLLAIHFPSNLAKASLLFLQDAIPRAVEKSNGAKIESVA